jgi:hypothetical protein
MNDELQQKRVSWTRVKDMPAIERLIDADKRGSLSAIYSGLYTELIDKDARQQQAVTWGVTILAGSGLIGVVTGSSSIQPISAVFIGILLALVTGILTRLIRFLSEERMSIARQLDRVHQIMGAFEDGYFYREGALFDPVWRGWGFDPERDANTRIARFFVLFLWAAFAADVFVLLTLAVGFTHGIKSA